MSKVTCMPVTAYNRTISTIRDYPRMKRELDQLKADVGCISATNYDGMPKGGTSDGLADKIAHLVDLERDMEKMQNCIDTMPDDMRDGILRNILYNEPYPLNDYAQIVPSLRVWQKEKQKFVICFAKAMKIWYK